MIPEKTIVLCLDIDECILNSRVHSQGFVDFNGSELYDDESAWINCLEQISGFCQWHDVDCIVQIISAKKTALPDSTTDIVSTRLAKFLHVLDKQGQRVVKDFSLIEGHPSHYLCRQYRIHNPSCDLLVENARLKEHHVEGYNKNHIKHYADTILGFFNENELPPIHLCYKNDPPSFREPSKWQVMEVIRTFFSRPIPPKNMFMLDNSDGNLIKIRKGSPPFQTISAQELEMDTSVAGKPGRTLACKLIMEDMQAQILARVREICRETLEMHLKSSSAPSSIFSASVACVEKTNQIIPDNGLEVEQPGSISYGALKGLTSGHR